MNKAYPYSSVVAQTTGKLPSSIYSQMQHYRINLVEPRRELFIPAPHIRMGYSISVLWFIDRPQLPTNATHISDTIAFAILLFWSISKQFHLE